jgi:hypothetical protein
MRARKVRGARIMPQHFHGMVEIANRIAELPCPFRIQREAPPSGTEELPIPQVLGQPRTPLAPLESTTVISQFRVGRCRLAHELKSAKQQLLTTSNPQRFRGDSERFIGLSNVNARDYKQDLN